MNQVSATIDRLKLCQKARAAGVRVSYTTDPAWLVNMAINRRAGWMDDPGFARGSCQPINGKYPRRAEGDGEFLQAQRLARHLSLGNTRVNPQDIPARYRHRLAHRIRENEF